jgi:hypothetical protein
VSEKNKYPVLYGLSDQEERELHSVEDVARFICDNGTVSDVVVTKPDGTQLLDTFGIYINRISDMEYREDLLKVLIPMQSELDGIHDMPDLETEALQPIEPQM